MNVGIFVTSINPRSPSQARLQEAIFGGLEKAGSGRYEFKTFSHDKKAKSTLRWPHYAIQKRGKWPEAFRQILARTAAALLALWSMLGVTGGRTTTRLKGWATVEPKHFQQLRDLNIRIMWNMNQHELPVPIPYIRTLWEANHLIHSMYPEYSYTRFGFNGLDGGMANSVARASYIVTGTEEGKRQIIGMLGAHPGKIHVIPFPAPTLPAPDATNSTPLPYFLYPAKFWPHKNHVVVLEALNLLRQSHGIAQRCIFTGADEGNLAYIHAYAERLGVADLIDYRGVVSDGELANLYSGATALIYASAVGPDNLPPLEAMALGCPAIVADVPGAREQYGDAALYFPPMDENALAGMVVSLMHDEQLRTSLIANGRTRAATLSPARYASQIIEILDEFSRVARAWERSDSAFT